jgi:thiol-disulfide isomerase/thioredoxin
MKNASDIVLKILAIILLIAAVLKGWQLITEPVANNSIWTYRPFLILTVEFELALAIWLLSSLFKKAAWLASLLCFSVFSVITLYKGITGAESCGCFGSIHVNPWITLFAIDLPAVLSLALFRPKGENLLAWPSIPRFATAAAVGLLVLGITAPVLAFNEPPTITSSYEVLEPETWVGRKLPILEHIDIGKQLEKGIWLILLYHHDCPDCAAAIPKYEQMARDMAGNEDFLRIALIEVPPYGQRPINDNSPCKLGRLTDTKEWFVTTPAVALLTNSRITSAWEGKAPDFETILQNIAKIQKNSRKYASFINKSMNTNALLWKGGEQYARIVG